MLVLENPVQRYRWGAVDGLSSLFGTAPSGGPEAELWVGTHPVAPSRVVAGGRLDEVVALDAPGLLGDDAVARHGPHLPFLLKVLAVGASLSIQLHPDVDQARAGYEREERDGPPPDSPRRNYRDPSAKPEVLVALAPTWALTGFRSGADAAARLRGVGDRRTDALAERVEADVDARAALVHLLTLPGPERDGLADLLRRVGGEARPADGNDDTPPADPAGWVARLAAEHPGDPTALAPLILELVRLEPGQGVFLPAGVPHAYLRGRGVELMSASDNVVRGGLTAKHVDAAELVALLAAPGVGVERLDGERVDGPYRRYAPTGADLALHHGPGDAGSAPNPTGPGPAVVLAVATAVTVRVGPEVADAAPGRAILVTAEERSAAVVEGDAWIASLRSG